MAAAFDSRQAANDNIHAARKPAGLPAGRSNPETSSKVHSFSTAVLPAPGMTRRLQPLLVMPKPGNRRSSLSDNRERYPCGFHLHEKQRICGQTVSRFTTGS